MSPAVIRPEVLAWPERVWHEQCEKCLKWSPVGRHKCNILVVPELPKSLVVEAKVLVPASEIKPVKPVSSPKSIKEELVELEQRISAGYWPKGMSKGCSSCKHIKRWKSGKPDCKRGIEKCKYEARQEVATCG